MKASMRKNGRCDKHECTYVGPLVDCGLFFLCPTHSGPPPEVGDAEAVMDFVGGREHMRDAVNVIEHRTVEGVVIGLLAAVKKLSERVRQLESSRIGKVENVKVEHRGLSLEEHQETAKDLWEEK